MYWQDEPKSRLIDTGSQQHYANHWPGNLVSLSCRGPVGTSIHQYGLIIATKLDERINIERRQRYEEEFKVDFSVMRSGKVPVKNQSPYDRDFDFTVHREYFTIATALILTDTTMKWYDLHRRDGTRIWHHVKR